MKSEPRTRLETLKEIVAFLKQKGSSVFNLQDVTKIGIDFETAKELVSVIEYCQKQMPRVQSSTSEGRFFVEAEYSELQEEMRAEIDRLRELILTGFEDSISHAPAAPPGAPPSTRPMTLMGELRIAIKARIEKMQRDEMREGDSILIEFPEKEFSAKFICGVCGHTIDFPYHCDSGPLQFNTQKRELYCDICGYRSTIPKHCGKYMSAEYYEGDKPLALVRIKDDELYRRSPDWYAHEDEKT